MDNNNVMKQYRNIPFKYVEWTTWNGKTSTGYHCEDKSLLEGVDTISFGTKTIIEMQEMIDHYVDNRIENLESQALEDRAMDEFMTRV
tara:strand:- start:74 stop:337 length:264 start_codon:yes stop_codon:yes gene_type:complete